jgi:nucleotide-binding universal stress UspA family protein
MIRKILVPLDGSEFAEAAIDVARSLADHHRAELEFVTVHRPVFLLRRPSGAPVADPTLDGEMRSAMQDYLDRIATAERARTTAPIGATFAEGDVDDEILNAIRAKSADLVVMTTHGRGGLERMWLGSVADEIIRRAHVPVLLVRSTASGGTPRSIGEWRRVVIALAGNEADERVIDATFAVTDRERAQYSLVHAVASNFLPVTVGSAGPPSELAGLPVSIDQAELPHARRYVEGVAERLVATGIAATAAVESGGSVARTVVEYATRVGAGLIAVGTRAPGRFERQTMGSVADKVLRSTEASVLVCPPQREVQRP